MERVAKSHFFSLTKCIHRDKEMCPSGRRSSIANRVLGETLTEGSNPSISTRYTIQIPYAPLAQLDRASGYGPEGQEFESLRVYFPSPAKFNLAGLFIFLAAKDSLHQQGFFIFLLVTRLIRENLKKQKREPTLPYDAHQVTSSRCLHLQ